MSYLPLNPADCAERIAAAARIVALTGAGVSTSVGVPDFRGPSGLYVTRAYDPERVFDIDAFDRDPEPFYAFSRDFLALLGTVRPSPVHRFLAALEETGKRLTVVTQNIDGLHHEAGSTWVLPIHGDYESAHCRRCGAAVPGEGLRRHLKGDPGVPRCPCGGVIKPDVVFFGEPVRHLDEALRESEAADLFLALGTSLAVYPAAGLPGYAKGDVLVVNRGPVGIRPGPRVRLADEDLDSFFNATAERLGMDIGETAAGRRFRLANRTRKR